MPKLLRKVAILKMSDEDFSILLRILESLPIEIIHLCQRLNMQQKNPHFLITNEIISALVRLKQENTINKKWKTVLDNFLGFANHNTITT